MVIFKFFRISLILCVLAPVFSFSFGDQGAQDFLDRIESYLEQKDIESYLKLVAPGIREQEEINLREKFEHFNIENVAVFISRRQITIENGIRTYLNVVFENPETVVIEVWRLDIVNSSDEWQLNEKEIIKSVQNLYKIRIPSGREERVSRVEIKHADIQITFDNPVVFYDNLPDVETAILVIGDGQLRFSPSVQREKHQLELLYKKEYLQDRLNYAFVRCSDSLFKNNIRIEKSQENSLPINESDKNRAYSLFTKHHYRSFTVENSLDGKLLSVIPQEDEAVIEFEGDKIGKFTYIFSPFSDEEVTLYQWEKERFLNIYSPREEENTKRFFISFGEKFDVLRYSMDIDFKPDDYYISGKAEIEIESKTGNLDRVQLKLNPDLEILRITDDNNNELFFVKDKLRTNLYIYFIDPILRSQSTKVIIYYRGKIPPSRTVEDALSVGQVDNLYLEMPIRSETYLYSLNSQWYPEPPEGDYFTSRVKIIIPPEFEVVSNGLIVEQSKLQQMDRVEDLDRVGRKVFVFESKKPIKYMSFIVGRLIIKDEETNPLPLKYYRTVEVILPRLNIFEEAKRILQFYEQKFGPFPFEGLSIVHRLWQESGGHSPASFIVLNQLPQLQTIQLKRMESPVNLTRWSEYYLAHEIAHQWWGQGVTWDRYRDQWISEGLAQFSTVLYLREKHGESAYSNILNKMSGWTEKKAKWGPIIFGSRISYFDYLAFQSIVYNKSSLVLNMLKDMLGEELFFLGIREFFDRFKYRAAGTHDFVATFSEISQKNLMPFFDAWFKSYTLPEVEVSRHIEQVADKFRLKLELSQKRDTFIFPLWVEWSENGENVRKMFVVDKKEYSVQFDLSHRPKKIQINPDNAVPGKFY